MLTLALDPSSTATGWALFQGRELKEWGTVRRQKGQSLRDYALAVRKAMPLYRAVVYEINDTPMPRARQASLGKCHEATGRILQALYADGEPIQADRKKKAQRRVEVVMVYQIKERISEHACDAIMLGHRVVNDPKRWEPGHD